MPSRERKKISPIQLSERDQALIAKTARAGGIGEDNEPKKAIAEAVAPAPIKKQATKAKPKPEAKTQFKATDLRCYVATGSKLAEALQEEIDALDDVARQFVKPATILKQFLTQNDEAIAALFRKNNPLKR